MIIAYDPLWRAKASAFKTSNSASLSAPLVRSEASLSISPIKTYCFCADGTFAEMGPVLSVAFFAFGDAAEAALSSEAIEAAKGAGKR
jgi:hypothetical protein